MPGLTGVETLKIIKEKYPEIEVVLISSGDDNTARMTVEALENGAFDFILKPNSDNLERNMLFIRNKLNSIFNQIKVKKISEIEFEKEKKMEIISEKIQKKEKTIISTPKIILIASSTGGPSALDKLFIKLNKSIKTPIIITQHMPEKFTQILAQSLKSKTKMNFVEVQENEEICEGKIYIAAGGKHLYLEKIENKIIAKYKNDDPIINVKPSADVLFKSLTNVYDKNTNILAVILTGMGNDGEKGIKHLKENLKCYCITQNEKSCVVYGMPMRVEKAGFSDESLDIEIIGNRISKIISGDFNGWK